MPQATPEHGNDSYLAIVDYAIGMPKNQVVSYFHVQWKRNATIEAERCECNLFIANG
jgi:hypothetical protein